VKLTKELIDQEVADILNDEKWEDRDVIFMKHIENGDYDRFGLMLRIERTAIYDDELTLIRKYPSTHDLVADGWIVD
jgi:hypothetical protein